MGEELPPAELRGPWDAVIHSAASTRWTMTREEATAANLAPLRAALDLSDTRTRFVHLSTAYVASRSRAVSGAEFDGYRNGYEWSKATCESMVTQHDLGSISIVRPPLIIGRRNDGAVSRFIGLYTIIHALTTGLGAALVGDAQGYAEVAPVDLVAETVLERAFRPTPEPTEIEVISGGEQCLTLSELVDIICRTLSEWRAERGLSPVTVPPLITTERWHRLFLPLADAYLTPVQREAVRLLSMFEAYASMKEPITPTRQVENIADLITTSVRYWADAKPLAAAAVPRHWTGVGQRAAS